MNSPKKPNLDAKDILAMIIAAFELLLPPVLIIFGAVIAIYYVLKFLTT
ncbi:conserved protein of unknown function [Tepidanaerobacter acetatoxydans Re1]|uniref:Uncharacterized protein n=1 Tax=Tepidanaerobacter acetatoxydans (strain DSM 21804 / JCM 16047 / Re1) TaxID=1209989 RepID=F4LWE7_TEPAE|nr:hypothetical protein [Tepidanaerobacter acetatoxydans]AEE91745.1 hypothetical protein TepRe1_1606 [Tepidanaerobacter acetatoxydans Re1]CCP26515.1 conserved protein of unknown function [Tepidanaerobacter acetatoxydans Re1]